MSIDTIYATLQAQGNPVSLDDASLGTAGLDAVLGSSGLPVAIIVTLPGALPAPVGDTLSFTGTSTFLAGTEQAWGGTNGFLDGDPFDVAVTITDDGAGTVTLSVTVDLPDGWVLGDSFYAFTGGSFTADVLLSPSLAFNYGVASVSDGLTLSAEINPVGPLVPLDSLAEIPDGTRASGLMVLNTGGPAFILNAALGRVKLTLYTLDDLSNASYQLSLSYLVAETVEADSPNVVPDTANLFQAYSNTVSSSSGAPYRMQLTLGQADSVTLTYVGDASSNGGMTDSVYDSLFPDAAAYPGELNSAMVASAAGLTAFGVTSFGMRGNPQTGNVDIVFATLGMTSEWQPVASLPEFVVKKFDMNWSYLFDQSGSLFGSIAAALDLGGVVFSLDIEYPSMSFSGNVVASVSFTLSQLNGTVFDVFPNQAPANPDLASITFSDFGVSLDYYTSDVVFSCTADAAITLSGVDVILNSASLEMAYSTASGSSYALSGIFSVENWRFGISARITETAMLFSGNLLNAQVVIVSDVVNQLLGDVATPNEFSLALTVESFALSISSGTGVEATGAVAVSGSVAWDLLACGVNLGGDFGFDIQSIDSCATWTGSIVGDVAIAGLTFDVSYVWGPTVTLLTGTFASGAAYDWNAFVATFGNTQENYPGNTTIQPNLETGASLTVSYDFTHKIFTIIGSAATSDVGMAGFYQQLPAVVNNGAGFGFAAGVQFTLTPGFFAGIAEDLSLFDTDEVYSFGLSTTMTITYANFRSTTYQPPVGSSGFPGIYPGITFTGTFSWTACDDSTTYGAMSLMTTDTATLDIVIGFYYDDFGNWLFEFAGAIENIAWTLGESTTLNGASVAFTMTELGYYEVLVSVDLSLYPGTGRVIPSTDAGHDTLNFLGEIAFIENLGAVTGFAAIFMNSTWYEPFDIEGLVVGQMGLLLGIGEIAGEPVPSFGLTGFLSYTPLDMQAYLSIYFNGVSPQDSLFIGSFSEIDFMSFSKMLAWATNTTIPSLLQETLDVYGVEPIPLDVASATTTLTQADFDALNEYQIPDAFRSLVTELGYPMGPETSSSTCVTQVVVRQNIDDPNNEWFIADYTTGDIFHLIEETTNPVSYSLSIDPWIYVVPATTTLGNMTFYEGYGFGARLLLVGMTFDIYAKLKPLSSGNWAGYWGLQFNATASDPVSYPVIPGGSAWSLLTITACSDPDKGPSVALCTYQDGDTEPYFRLDADVTLLGILSAGALVEILTSGLSFYLDLSLTLPDFSGDGTSCAALSASMTCLINEQEGFTASFPLSFAITATTDSYSIGGVMVLPAIKLDTSMGVQFTVSFPYAASEALNASFVGNIVFTWGDQTFTASIAFTLGDLDALMETITQWVIQNAETLLKDLLEDTADWARAVANDLFRMEADATAAALKALGAGYEDAVKLMTQIAYTADEVYYAVLDAYAMVDDVDALIQAVTDSFRLQLNYGAITQNVAPATTDTDPTALIAWLADTAAVDYQTFQWTAMNQSSAGAIVAVTASLLDEITLDVTLADPGPYAAHFKGLGIDEILPYQRLSDTRGVFSASFKSKTERVMSFGPFQFQFPDMELSFYTDGAWELNFGYSDDLSTPGSIALSTPAYLSLTGQGGFKLYSLSTGTTLPSNWKPVNYACGVSASMSMSATGSVDDGMLKGNWSLTYTGGFTAIAGYGTGYDPNSTSDDPVTDQGDRTPSQFNATITLGFSGALYGTVDFGLVSASVHVSISLSRAISFDYGEPVSLSTTVHVKVGASIRIKLGFFTIKISFTYSSDVAVGTVLPWSFETSPQSAALASTAYEPIAWRQRRTLPQVSQSAATSTVPLTLWFLPELTLTYEAGKSGTPQVLFNLAIDYAQSNPNCTFNLLMRTLLQWALEQAGETGTDGTLTVSALRNLHGRLRAKPRLSRLYDGDEPTTQLTYATLVSFFEESFTSVTIAAVPASDGEQSAITFAMIPDLISYGAKTDGTMQPITDFAAWNMQPVTYEDAVVAYNALFQVSGEDDNTASLSPDSAPASLATYVFLAYFEYLLQSGSSEALSQTGAVTLDMITQEQWDALTFDQTASGVTISFRGGVQVPVTVADGSDREALYLASGQQTALSAITPDSGSGTWSTGVDLTVQPGAGGGWLSVDAGVLGAFSADNINEILDLSVDAPLALQPSSTLTASATSYVFSTFTGYQPTGAVASTLADIPASLLAAPGTVMLYEGTTGGSGTAVAADIQWGALLTVTLRKVTYSDGSQDETTYALAGIATGDVDTLYELQSAVQDGMTYSLTLLLPTAGGYVDGSNIAADTVLLCTNFSTQGTPSTEAVYSSALADDTGQGDSVADAAFTDVVDALQILINFSQTNAAGYYLTLLTEDQGLTALFSGSVTADVAILARRGTAVSGSMATASMAGDTVLLVAQSADTLDGSGMYAVSTTALSYQPSYDPGILPISVTRPNPDPSGDSDERQTWLDQLYSIFSVAITGTGYADLGFAPPASPSDDGDTWTYFMSVPLTNLLATGPSDDPYAAVGTIPTVTAQIRDSFGNATTTDLAPFTVAQTYTDLLIGPTSWIGSQLLWEPGETVATLVLTLSIDQTILDTNADTARPLYEQALWQLSRAADVAFQITSSLAPNTVTIIDAAGQQAITAYVAGVSLYLDGETDQLPDPVTLTCTVAQATTGMPPVAITVDLTLMRVANVDATDAALLPGIAAVTAPATADMTEGLQAFAARFQADFPELVLASGVSDGSQLWAIAASLLAPEIAGNATYFAPAPAYTSLQSGTVAIPLYSFAGGTGGSAETAYSSVDCDSLLQSSFSFIDQILGGSYAAASYKADPDDYRRLVSGRAALGQLYSEKQLRYLFEDQADSDADAESLAQETYADRLQNALSDAYAIDGVFTFPATWDKTLPEGWQGLGLTLWGQVAPSDGSSGALSTTSQLTLSDDGLETAAALLPFVFQPSDLTADATLETPLTFSVSHVGMAGSDGETWLALAIPVSLAIGSGDVALPVVDRFFPETPTLDSQTATAAGTAASFDALFDWTYGATLSVEPVAQDVATLTIKYNLDSQSTAQAARVTLAAATPALTLAQASVRFQAGAAQIQPVLTELLDDGENAAEIVEALADLVDGLRYNTTWSDASTSMAMLSAVETMPPTVLSIQMQETDPDTGQWTLSISATDLPAGATLSATVTNAATGTATASTSGSSLSVTFTPVATNTPVDLQISIAGLDVRLFHNAQTSVYVTRNADLAGPSGGIIALDFILTTAEVEFPQPVAPVISGPSTGYDIASIVAPADKSLGGWLDALLTEIAGTAADPRIAVVLGYRFALYKGKDATGVTQTAYATQPVTVSTTVQLTDVADSGLTIADYADNLADAFTQWAAAQPSPSESAEILVTVYLFAAATSASTTLIRLPNLYLSMANVE
ncbi:hypothetical protein [Niveispirillum irakense]|uniref:hypothetical protein n=1 Tax=Niveispirillum irakense TaxID=34011 RepID=UPI000428B7BB|nr:hypothetical protein [Niveispirillum irakense]